MFESFLTRAFLKSSRGITVLSTKKLLYYFENDDMNTGRGLMIIHDMITEATDV